MLIAFAYIALGGFALHAAGTRNDTGVVLSLLGMFILTLGIMIHSVVAPTVASADVLVLQIEAVGDRALTGRF